MLLEDAEESMQLPVDTVLGMEMAAARVQEISEAVDSSANKIATSAQNESRPNPTQKMFRLSTMSPFSMSRRRIKSSARLGRRDLPCWASFPLVILLVVN